MPREPKCNCEECQLCRQRESMRLLRAERRKLRDVIWPTDDWGTQARAEAEWLSRYVCPLADIDAVRWAISKASARRAAAE